LSAQKVHLLGWLPGTQLIPEHGWSRLTTLHVSNEAENGEPQLQNKRGRLTTLRVSNEAENGEPLLQKKRGTQKQTFFGGFSV